MKLAFAATTIMAALHLCPAGAAQLVLVEAGVARAPVVVAAGATADTRRAAADLADYLEKISGARPPVLEGQPEPPPDSAIWVGWQPILVKLFPRLDFEFRHPEEILVAAGEKHLVIAGRDRLAGETQVEFGTANAVYTFLQDYLDVRWLWPGPLGEDVTARKTVALSPFTHRYHPQLRERTIRGITRRSPPETMDWSRFQRVMLTSEMRRGGISFDRWWELYHEAHPEYFALQPDGTRTPPAVKSVKICQANPAVWAQWLADAEQSLAADPAIELFLGAPTDGHNSGICVCADCRAWDTPDSAIWGRYYWRGMSQDYVAMTNRYARFVNRLARGLKARFPDRNLYVYDMAYGPNTPPPVRAELEDNVLIGYVGFFPLVGEETRAAQKEEWRAWAEKAPNLKYRPNLWYWAGGVWGLPEVALAGTIEDFRFLGEHNCVGLDVDTGRGHWATQGPMYYLIAQLAWNPFADGRALLADYYRRGFGPAAGEIERYWTMMEQARGAVMAHPDHRLGGSQKVTILGVIREIFSPAFLDQAEAVLAGAAAKADSGTEIHRQRVAFVRAGLDFTRLMLDNVPVMARVRETGGHDAAAVDKALETWVRIKALVDRFPFSVNYTNVRALMVGQYMGDMQDYFGPPADKFRQAAESGEPAPPPRSAAGAAEAGPFRFVPAEAAGWKLAFSDDFERPEPGPDWLALEGDWSVENGDLVCRGGKIVTARGFPGFQRLEFEALTDVKPFALFEKGTQPPVGVSDLSAFIQAAPEGNPILTGYFFQFGGAGNSRNQLRRAGATLWQDDDPALLITPDKVHRIVVENDEGRLRFIVDGQLVHEETENASLVGAGRDRVGFYFYTAARVRGMRLYIKPLDDGLI